MQLEAKLWLNVGVPLGPKEIGLLRHIHKTGSISQAAKALGMSYKCAWQMLDKVQKESKEALVEKKTGGVGGGGSVLTSYGTQLMQRYELLEGIFHLFGKELEEIESLQELEALCSNAEKVLPLRNRLKAKIEKIKCRDGECIVRLLTGSTSIKLKIDEKRARNLKKDQEVWITFSSDATVEKGGNLFRGIFLKKEGGLVEVAIGERVVRIAKPFVVKNMGVEFRIKSKDMKLWI